MGGSYHKGDSRNSCNVSILKTPTYTVLLFSLMPTENSKSKTNNTESSSRTREGLSKCDAGPEKQVNWPSVQAT